MLREAPFGQLIRWVTKNKFLQYPEEKPDFELPATYNALLNASTTKPVPIRTTTSGSVDRVEKKPTRRSSATSSTDSGTVDSSELEKKQTEKEDQSPYAPAGKDVEALGLSRTKSRLETVPYTEARLELEEQLSLARTETKPIVPLKTSDGTILVDVCRPSPLSIFQHPDFKALSATIYLKYLRTHC